MPYATVNSGPLQVRLHYELLVGLGSWEELLARDSSHQPLDGVREHLPLSRRLDLVEQGSAEVEAETLSVTSSCGERVLFLPGLAAKKTTEYLEQQVRHVLGLKDSAGQPLACACLVDMRGIGLSSIPQNKRHYTTDIMCGDIVDLMDHLGWHGEVHVVGQSLGALVALKVAAAVPSRVKSVTLLGGALSGLHILRSGLTNLPLTAAQMLLGRLQSKIRANLRIQYSQRYLSETAEDGRTRLQKLVDQIEADIQCKRTAAPLEVRRRKMVGRRGQMRACFQHSISKREAQAVAQAAHLRAIIVHGLHDRLISPAQVFQLGAAIRATVVATDAAHAGIGIEAAALVNHVLEVQIRGAGALAALLPGREAGAAPTGPAKKVEARAATAEQVIPLEASSTQRQREQAAGALGSPRSKLVKRVQTLPF